VQALGALVLAAAIFGVDAFSNATIAIAVLYGLVVLMAAPVLTREGVVAASAACFGLTVAGYLIEHAGEPPGMALLRCVVSLSALVMTTILVLRAKSALAEIARSERRYRTIFESIGSGLWEQDYSDVLAELHRRGCRTAADVERLAAEFPGSLLALMARVRTLDANAAAYALLGATERVGLEAALVDAPLPETGEMLQGLLSTLVEGRPSFHGEARLKRCDGREITVLVSARFGSDAGPTRVFVSATDVTDRVKAEESLRQTRDEIAHVSRLSTLGELTASIAHEVNQPLAAIVTNGEACLRWLNRPVPDLGEAKACAAEVIGEGRRAAEVVKRLRGMAGRSPAHQSRADLNDVVRESVAILDRQLRSDGIVVEATLVDEALPVLCDRVQLQQVVVNLMLNAGHAMEGCADKRIVVSTRRQDDGVCLGVLDSGPGMTDEVLMQLFTPFFTTRSDGMGMGLSICQSIVTAHGGRIWGGNDPDGGGALFRVALPLTAGVTR